jgi:hypothetical protein
MPVDRAEALRSYLLGSLPLERLDQILLPTIQRSRGNVHLTVVLLVAAIMGLILMGFLPPPRLSHRTIAKTEAVSGGWQ